ncbi:MAG: hypothetical protein ACXACP_09815 [Candidatus Hodarchaeales archaeon]|jgi:hypothetical protein
MFSGLIVTTMGDRGPYPLLNLSSIPEDTAENLSVIGMTILFMGAGTVAERQHYRLHGSLPIPNSPDFEALAMSFTVSPTHTEDLRIDQHGRESTIWLLFESIHRDQIFHLHQEIERALKEETRQIKDEEDLTDPDKMGAILSRMKSITESPEQLFSIPDQPEPLDIIEKGGLEFFTVSSEGELITVEPTADIHALQVLILVNTILKRIFLIKLKNDMPQRLLFLAGTSASNINTNRFKNTFTIRDVSDPMERDMILENIDDFQRLGTQ